ncbi:MAG: hypothetical protein GC178_10225 [Flavobacteriales bacterium]|nr:hypothetical protein [Flavobacteriales bacterium]
MPIPLQLGVEFTAAEVDAMKAAAQTIIDTIEGKVSFNMSNEERASLSTVSDERAPYVLKSVAEYGVDYPNLNGLAYQHDLAAKDLATYGFMFEVLTKLSEATEKVEELQMVAGHFTYKFMRDQYDNAEKYRADNVAGAQVVYDGLKGAFEGQGPQNPSPSDPDTSGTT